MSQFQEKVFAACAKKEALFDESLGRYALRSMPCALCSLELILLCQLL